MEVRIKVRVGVGLGKENGVRECVGGGWVIDGNSRENVNEGKCVCVVEGLSESESGIMYGGSASGEV